MSWSLSRRSRAERAAEDGALAVEAALVFPVILLLALGIVEWSLVLRDQIQVTTLARSAARTASALAPLQQPFVPTPPIPGQVVAAIDAATTSLPRGSVESILVYKANPTGFPGPDSNHSTMACSVALSTCGRYDWDPIGNRYVRIGSAQWPATDINSCLGTVAPTGMSVGVYLVAKHPMITGVFGNSKTLTSRAVMRFEPQPPGRCSP